MPLVLTATISNHGFREGSQILDRTTLAAEIAEAARVRGALVVALPAGYLFCENERRAKGLARALALVFGWHGISLLAGIDVSGAKHSKEDVDKNGCEVDDHVSEGKLPFFYFASEPPGRVTRWWRQRSTTSSNAGLVPPRLDTHSARTVRLGGVLIALVACGEIYNPGLGEILAAARPDVVIDLGHSSMGRGFQHSFPGIARATGAPILHAQHVAATNVAPTQWRAFPKSIDQPWAPAPDARVGTRATAPAAQGLWAELLITRITTRGSV